MKTDSAALAATEISMSNVFIKDAASAQSHGTGRGHRDTIKGVILVLVQALPIMAVVSLFPAMPRLFEQFGDAPNAAFLIPMIITVPSLCIALLSPVAGWLVDRVGRRPVMNAALALYCVTGLAPVFLNDLGAIVVSRALLGVAEACIVTVASTLIADYFGEGRYRWLAWQSAIGSIFGTVLIALGGWLADFSWRGPFCIYVAVAPLLLMSILFLDEPKPSVQPAELNPAAPVLSFPWRAAAIVGLVSLVASTLYYIEPIHIATVLQSTGAGSTTRIGLIQAATSVAYILGALLYRRLHACSIGLLLGLAGGLIGIGMIGIGFAATWQAAALWAVPQQLGAGMVIPSLIAWAQSRMPFEQRGRAMGIWATFFFSGLFLCPTLVTITTSHAGDLSSAIWILGAVTVAAAALSVAFIRQGKATVAH